MDYLTVVLVGPTGHGKSATGNSILGKKAFKSREAFISRSRSSRVTETCELQTSVLEDGQTINVIDTPGFLHTKSELLGEEAKKCIDLASNKIHAFLFVISREQRISTEDGIDAVQNLQTIFGENITNYMIAVCTPQSHNLNKDIIDLCEGRFVYFFNKTKDEVQKSNQVQNLLSQVKTVISHNGGKPFMSQVFELQKQAESAARDATTRLERLLEAQTTTMNAIKKETTQIIDVVEARLRDTTTSLKQQMEATAMKADKRAQKYLKEETSELIQRISKSYKEQMTQRLEAVEQRVLDTATRLEQQLAEAHAAQMRVNEIAQCEISEMILQMTQRINEEAELRVKDVTTRLEQQLAQAEAARLKSDERAQEAQKNSDKHIQKLKEMLERAASRMTQRINEVESSVKDVATRLEHQAQKNSDEQIQNLKEMFERAEKARQKNSDEQIQKLKEMLEGAESRRSENISDFGSSSFHVYDPSTYLLQSTIK